ncbi:MAG: hypothetical protein ACOZB0_05960 [Pseudomonadota bacterium]
MNQASDAATGGGSYSPENILQTVYWRGERTEYIEATDADGEMILDADGDPTYQPVTDTVDILDVQTKQEQAGESPYQCR